MLRIYDQLPRCSPCPNMQVTLRPGSGRWVRLHAPHTLVVCAALANSEMEYTVLLLYYYSSCFHVFCLKNSWRAGEMAQQSNGPGFDSQRPHAHNWL